MYISIQLNAQVKDLIKSVQYLNENKQKKRPKQSGRLI